MLRNRVGRVKEYREASQRLATQRLAETPALFGERRQPTAAYIVVPRHGSERRRHIPMMFVAPDVIAHDSTLTVNSSDLYWFGILQSQMFVAWVRAVGGKIKGDPRVSAEMTYNTFPFPDQPGPAAKDRVRQAAKDVLDARSQHPGEPLETLYDLTAMPPALVTAQRAVDRAVDALYGRGSFDETRRVARLFERYQQRIGGLDGA